MNHEQAKEVVELLKKQNENMEALIIGLQDFMNMWREDKNYAHRVIVENKDYRGH